MGSTTGQQKSYGKILKSDESIRRQRIENEQKNTLIDMLLEHESKISKPPKYIYNGDRNSFHVPFQTEMYKEWVRSWN